MGSNEKTFAILMLCGIIGIILAIIEQMLYGSGILIDEYITGSITLRDLQLITIIIWEIIGIGIAALTCRG